MARRSLVSSRTLKLSCVLGALVAWNGCLVFTSISDLGGQTRPTADASDEGLEGGGLRDVDGGTDAPGSFGSALLIARTAPGLRGISVDSTRVYFANEDTSEVRFAPKTGDGDAGSSLLAAVAKPTDLAIDSSRVYWIQNDGTANLGGSFPFRSIRKDGTDPLNGGGNYFTSRRMTMAGGQVFTSTLSAGSQWYVMRDGTGLGAAKPTGSNCVVSDGATVFYEMRGVLYTHPDPDSGVPFATADATDLAVDETSLYWITADGAVQKLEKTKRGEKPIDLAAGLSGTARIAVDEQSVYVSMWGLGPETGKVVRIPKAGGRAVDVATGLREPWGIAVDATGLYVANHGDGTILAVPRE
jgi:hypothetical protein